jgi:hypothetical protein
VPDRRRRFGAIVAAVVYPFVADAQPRPPMPPPPREGPPITAPVPAQLALVGSSLAMEWPPLGLGERPMVVVETV